MKKGLYAVAAGLVVASQMSVAGPNPYSDCGIGASVFPNNTAAAAISNATWDLGTTAIASATLSPETCAERNTMAAQFIIDSYDSLVEDTARGQGEYLNAALELSACYGPVRQNVIADVRASMAATVSAPQYDAMSLTEKAQSYYSALHTASAVCAG